MYLDYWSLQRAPFDAVPDSRFFFGVPQHEQALAAISYAVREGGEPVAIASPAGCGKTLLLRALRRQLPPEQYQVVFLPELATTQVSLLRQVAYNMVHTVAADAAGAMDTIIQFAAQSKQQDQSIVIMLDDWPADASPAALDELRWLMNLDEENAPLNFVFAGELIESQASWPTWLRQRLLTVAVLGPLEREQVPAYLEHRLRAAGHPQGTLFTPAAAATIAEWAHCTPRLVNRVANLALQIAALQLAEQVDETAIQQAIERLSAFVATNAASAIGAQT